MNGMWNSELAVLRTTLPLYGSTESPGEVHGIRTGGIGSAQNGAGVTRVAHIVQNHDQSWIVGSVEIQEPAHGGDPLGVHGLAHREQDLLWHLRHAHTGVVGRISDVRLRRRKSRR